MELFSALRSLFWQPIVADNEPAAAAGHESTAAAGNEPHNAVVVRLCKEHSPREKTREDTPQPVSSRLSLLPEQGCKPASAAAAGKDSQDNEFEKKQAEKLLSPIEEEENSSSEESSEESLEHSVTSPNYDDWTRKRELERARKGEVTKRTCFSFGTAR